MVWIPLHHKVKAHVMCENRPETMLLYKVQQKTNVLHFSVCLVYFISFAAEDCFCLSKNID